jgi:hypothetical protein
LFFKKCPPAPAAVSAIAVDTVITVKWMF